MRQILPLILAAVLLLSGCALAPDNFTLVVRTGDRTAIQGLNVGIGYSNPFKPRPVTIQPAPQ